MQSCSSGIAPILKGDKLSKMQCPRNNMEREANEENSLCISCGEFDVCSNMYKTGYQLYCRYVRKIPK